MNPPCPTSDPSGSPSPVPSLRDSAAATRSGGFSLLEAIIALGILGIVLTSMLTLLAQHSAVDRRVDGHLGALRALEAHHEALRANWNPLLGQSENYWQAGRRQLIPLTSPTEVDAFVLWSEVTELAPAGLFKVQLKVQYRLGTQSYDQQLEALFWRG